MQGPCWLNEADSSLRVFADFVCFLCQASLLIDMLVILTTALQLLDMLVEFVKVLSLLGELFSQFSQALHLLVSDELGFVGLLAFGPAITLR